MVFVLGRQESNLFLKVMSLPWYRSTTPLRVLPTILRARLVCKLDIRFYSLACIGPASKPAGFALYLAPSRCEKSATCENCEA